MRFFVGLVAVLASTTVASAESYDATQPSSALPKDGYVGIGVEGGAQRDMLAGIRLDVGVRLGESPVFARAQLAGGDAGVLQDGHYQQARAGIEGRTCSTWVCAFLGVDAGYHHESITKEPWFCLFSCEDRETTMHEAHDLVAVPRVGLEVGKSVRARTSLELPLTTRLDEREGHVGVTLSLGLGYTF